MPFFGDFDGLKFLFEIFVKMNVFRLILKTLVLIGF